MFIGVIITGFFILPLVRCPLLADHFRRLSANQMPFFEKARDRVQKAATAGHHRHHLPSSFAILINLGPDGHFRNMYSSHSHNDACNSQQIWDPFNKQCRKLYCKDNYEIKDLHCVIDKNSNITTEDNSKPLIKFLDSKSKFVNVTLGFSLKPNVNKRWMADNQSPFIASFSKQFAIKWSIIAKRLTNVTVRFAVNDSSINFLITEDVHYMNDDLLSRLSQDVIEKKKNYTILSRTLTIDSIHTTLAEMNHFCEKESDMPIWYWDSDFIFQTKNNVNNIYVNKTGRVYYPGEYIGSVLYVVNYDSNNSLIHNSVSSNVVVCEQTLGDKRCPRILLNHSEYYFDHGRILRSKLGHVIKKYELTENQSIFVCLPKHGKPFNFMDVKIESILSTSLMSLSIILLFLVLLTFIRLPSLRSTINGCNSINLVTCLAVMQITFLLNQFTDQCRVTAVMFHFFILATISWSSVIAYDMHRVFVKASMTGRSNSRRVRIVYGSIAYLIPVLIVTISNIGDIFDLSVIKGDYGPILPSNVCWMRRKTAKIIYFIVPATIAVLCNFVLYLRIVCNIRSEIKSISSFKKVTRIPSSSSSTSTISIISSTDSATSSSRAFHQTSIYTRLSVPLGFTWIIALFSTVVPVECKLLIRIMSYLFIIANTSQGATFFLAFGVYKKLFSSE